MHISHGPAVELVTNAVGTSENSTARCYEAGPLQGFVKVLLGHVDVNLGGIQVRMPEPVHKGAQLHLCARMSYRRQFRKGCHFNAAHQFPQYPHSCTCTTPFYSCTTHERS